MFGNPACVRHAAMLFRCCSLRSLGHQVISGSAAGKIDHMLAGAAAGLDHVTGFAGKELLQHRPDRLMVAMKRRRVEAAVGFDRPAVLAEFHDIFRHGILPVWWVAEAYPLCRDRANHKNLTDISGPGAFRIPRCAAGMG